MAGFLAGLVYLLNGKKLLGIIPAMLFTLGVELIHGGLAFVIARPFPEAFEVVLLEFPQ